MKTKMLIGMLVGLALTGCAHETMRGSVAMKLNENEAHVCLGEKEVKAGDRVAFYRNDCTFKGGRFDAGQRCQKVPIGEGTILQTLNEHYSVVKVDPGVAFNEGTIVEKK